ncbi:unnamed protein product [Adineta steineri]|uniref:Cysteine-rich protein 1 n=2 Tax=Adineta steineri TaxID=433720 RepID=A0A818LDU1_9BILA|nr:unnamed protein product [Adineta steineri]CAF3626066.1 unnamed protein product [Adineta steineri]
MRRRTEFEKNMRRTPPSPTPRFSRTFDLLLSRFPDSANLSAISNNTTPPIMSSFRGNFQSDEKSGSKPGQWRAPVSAPLCALCNKTVYPAEEVNGAGQKYHKLCLKCTSCNTLLTSGSLNERDKKIYCVGCYRRQFGPRGVGRGLATALPTDLDTPPSSPSSHREENDSISELNNSDDIGFHRGTSIGSSPSRTSSDDDSRHTNSLPFTTQVTTREKPTTINRPSSTLTNIPAFKMMNISQNICPRCSKTVYSAEEVKAAGKSFHKRCYSCAHCKGSISGAHYCVHDGELYDNNCYQRLFGPKGVGFGVGAGALSTGK